MNLPFLKNRDKQKNFFLALLVKPHKIGAILFEEINSKLFILATHEVPSKDSTELTGESLLAASDKAISFVENSLPEGGTVEKTIFSVPYDWIEDGKIIKDQLEKLKKICQELGLVPVGYLTSVEAIIHLIEENEGAPVSAIFLEVSKSYAYAYLVRAGKILEFLAEEVTGGIIEAVEVLFKKIESVDVLPSKIILADYEGSENLQQEFLSHKWPKDIPFLHLPQVLVLDPGFENEAVVNGVAAQMELEVLSDVKTKPDEEQAPVLGGALTEVKSSEFGFLRERDVAKESSKVSEDLEKSELSPPGKSGKPVERDVVKNGEEEPNISYFKKGDVKDEREAESSYEPEGRETGGALVPAGFAGIFSSVRNIKIPSLPVLGGSSGQKNKLILIVAGFVLFVLLFSILYYNFILHAQVTIFADKKAIDKSENVNFSKNPGPDNSIKIDILSEEVKGDETKNSTGSKDTGDKAKGSVTLYNKTENTKTFSKGTILVGPNSLEFELLDDMNVASTSSFATTLSSANAKIQAVKFGKEYNLPSASNFTVKGFSSSDYIAKNSEAVGGGTKKTATVVSKQDLSDLLSQILTSLEKDALTKAKKEISGGEDLLPKSLTSDISDKSYTKKAGDEAGSVGISATVKYNLAKYNKSDIQKLTEGVSKSQVPGTYALLVGDSKTDIADLSVSKDGESASATLKVHAVYAPTIEPEKLASQLSGKSETSAEKNLRSINGVTDVNLSFKNRLPIFPKFLPFNSKNITIEVNN